MYLGKVSAKVEVEVKVKVKVKAKVEVKVKVKVNLQFGSQRKAVKAIKMGRSEPTGEIGMEISSEQ